MSDRRWKISKFLKKSKVKNLNRAEKMLEFWQLSVIIGIWTTFRRQYDDLCCANDVAGWERFGLCMNLGITALDCVVHALMPKQNNYDIFDEFWNQFFNNF